MENLILRPEFFIDLDGSITYGSVAIKGGQLIAIGDDVEKLKGHHLKLKNQVLMPGFVNGHSHAFQRVLRGLTERASPNLSDNFWTWREQMYSLVDRLNPDDLLVIAKLAYLEMLEAGFSHVGEFHYLHHQKGGLSYPDPLTMSATMVRAAHESGINLCLLPSAYHRHDFVNPIQEKQRRFFFPTVEEFLQLMDAAHHRFSDTSTSVGLAIHSVRAVPTDWLLPLKDFATRHAMPIHIHASEQAKEVADCLLHQGLSPIELLHRHDLLTPMTTLIHATHLINEDLKLIVKNACQICVCPSTEKNLGDGMVPLKPLMEQQIKISLGTDQHLRFDPFMEAINLEEQERLRLQERSVLNKSAYLYETLLPCLTRHGLSSLYPKRESKSLLGQSANLISVDLPPEYQWHGAKIALDALFLAPHRAKVKTVITNGHIVLQDGELLSLEKSLLIKEIQQFFRRKI